MASHSALGRALGDTSPHHKYFNRFNGEAFVGHTAETARAEAQKKNRLFKDRAVVAMSWYTYQFMITGNVIYTREYYTPRPKTIYDYGTSSGTSQCYSDSQNVMAKNSTYECPRYV